MTYFNTKVQMALDHSQGIDFALAVMAAVILYLCRLKYRTTYGLIEVAVGLYLASLAFQVKGGGDFDTADFDKSDFDVEHLSVVLTTFLGAIFVMVRGFDNIQSGWKRRDHQVKGHTYQGQPGGDPP